MPEGFRKVTTRIIPSWPGWVAAIRASFQLMGGRLSFLITTRVTISISSCLVDNFHLLREISWFKYSRCHLSQKWWRICCTSSQQFKRLAARLRKSFCGKLVREVPIRKWPGLKGSRSLGLEESGVKAANSGLPQSRQHMCVVVRRLKEIFLRFAWNVF